MVLTYRRKLVLQEKAHEYTERTCYTLHKEKIRFFFPEAQTQDL